jgi:hypothetical protein
LTNKKNKKIKLHGDEGDTNMVNRKDANGFLFRVLIGDVLSLKRITKFHSPNTPSSKMPIMVVPKLVRH